MDLLQMMWGGLRFDLAAILYINLLFMFLSLIPLPDNKPSWYNRLIFWSFIIPNAIGYAFNILDIFYFDFILKRSTVELFMFAGEHNIVSILIRFLYDYPLGWIGWIVLVYLTIRWYRLSGTSTVKPANTTSYYLGGIAILLIVGFLSISGIRGGFGRAIRPISINHAAAYVDRPLQMAIVLNTPFTIMRTLTKKALHPVHYYELSQLDSIYSPLVHFRADSTSHKKNIVILIVESLAKEYIGSLNRDVHFGKYQGYTPFLDTLIGQSTVYTNAYANGRKSIEALPAIISSIPSLAQPFVLSPYATNDINGLADILAPDGYQSAFFHGATRHSMGFQAFMRSAGFKKFYSREDYPDSGAYDGTWGIWDEEFLQFTAQKLDALQEPFVATVFTLSSHHPFRIPPKYQGVFAPGTLPIHATIRYVDYALKRFFESASKMPWYQHTLFVITADHCNQSDLSGYNSLLGAYSIPIIFFDPNDQHAMSNNTPAQQSDILPLILQKIGFRGSIITFGNTDPQKRPFVVLNASNTWHMIQEDFVLQFRDEKLLGLYDYRSDKLLKHNLLNRHPEIVESMSRVLKAFIQQYTNRLISNRISIQTDTAPILPQTEEGQF